MRQSLLTENCPSGLSKNKGTTAKWSYLLRLFSMISQCQSFGTNQVV
uniref:Uncharacterized protein n=1 Tax=Heterorhabditis bacteriophora TaxID=37862 RepID=A0A1I7XBR3_HETBA